MTEPGGPNPAADTPSAPADSLDAGLAAGFARPADAPAAALPAIPGYRVLREIARGGMGKVLAALDLGLGREVALKVLLPGAGADRFVREAKITARLPHPGIPPVHALGALADGSPFLAMKLVAGRTLADELAAADRPRLLQAFAQVCQAVGFAHSRGVIHRDLKPANVMVGAFGEVQVMDWGLAKDLADRPGAGEPRPPAAPAAPAAGGAGQSTLVGAPDESIDDRTLPGTVLGTPAYMAPEQARGEAADARSDVFALGGLLCAILTGKPPFGGETAREVIRKAGAASLAEAHARLGGCGADAELLALCRHCLSPIPVDRPADGRAVAGAMTAYLDGVQERLRAAEIARAQADERARAERRARRVQLVAASLVLVVLAGGIVGTTYGLVRAKQATGRAETAEGEARQRADELQQVSDFQAQMLKQVDPASAGLRLSGDVKARFAEALAKAGVPEGERAKQAEAFASQWSRVNATDAALELIDGTILKPAVAAIDKQLADQPVIDAALRTTLAERYLDLGLYDAAKPLFERALETRRRVLGEEHPDTLVSIGNVGAVLQKLGKLDLATTYDQEALEKSRRALGGDHPTTLEAVCNMGSVLKERGKPNEALPLLREALEGRRRLLGEDHPDTLNVMTELGLLLWDQGKPDEALSYLREVLERRRRLQGEDHRDTLKAVQDAAVVLKGQGKLREAADGFREVLEKRRRLFGEVHPLTLLAANNLGATLSDLGKPDEAEALMREALTSQRLLLGVDHPSTLDSLNNLAVFLIQRGKLAEAEPMCRELLERRRRVSGPDHLNTLIATSVMGYLLLRQNKPDRAEPFVREAIAISRRTNGEDHRETLTYTHNLGMLLREQHRLAEAEPNFRVVMERAGQTLGAAHPITMSATTNLADVLNQQKRFEEAAGLLAGAEIVARQNANTTSERSLASILTKLGQARAGLKQLGEAEAKLLEAHRLWLKTRGEASPDTRNCTRALADLYTAWNAAQPGQGYDAKAAAWAAKLGAQ